MLKDIIANKKLIAKLAKNEEACQGNMKAKNEN